MNTNYLYENYKDFEENCYELFTRQATSFLYYFKDSARFTVTTDHFFKMDEKGYFLKDGVPGNYWYNMCQIIFKENCNRFAKLMNYCFRKQKINLFPNQNKYKDELNQHDIRFMLFLEKIKAYKSEPGYFYNPDVFKVYDKEGIKSDLKEALLIRTKAKTNSEATDEQNQIINYLSSNMHASEHISI